jgi:acetyl-CoA carboxylase biotin carboxyl carrier protein
MTVEEIRELIKLATETKVAELEVQRGDDRVRIRLPVAGDSPGTVTTTTTTPLTTPAASVPAISGSRAGDRSSGPPADGTLLVKSPIVGTFYESASPGTPPFVRVGEAVQPGKVLCIIESMKLMNEIESEVAGVIEAKLVPNGQPVEYGEALFVIRAV